MQNDYYAILNTVLYGLTNGFITTSLYVLGPRRVKKEYKEAVAYLNVMGLICGIFAGS